MMEQSDWLNLLFAISAATAFFWALFDGLKRKSPSYQQRILASLDRMPDGARERFSVLFLPQKMLERFNHSVIIGLGTTIFLSLTSIWIILGCVLGGRPVYSLAITALGGVCGAILGEFLLNHSATKINLPRPN